VSQFHLHGLGGSRRTRHFQAEEADLEGQMVVTGILGQYGTQEGTMRESGRGRVSHSMAGSLHRFLVLAFATRTALENMEMRL